MPFRPPQLIESDEILLRPPAPEDAQALFDEMLSDAETMRYLPFPRHTTLDDTLAYIEESRRGWESGSLLRWLLVDKATGNRCNHQSPGRQPKAPRGPPGSAQIDQVAACAARDLSTLRMLRDRRSRAKRHGTPGFRAGGQAHEL